jgi:hypothetical protein
VAALGSFVAFLKEASQCPGNLRRHCRLSSGHCQICFPRTWATLLDMSRLKPYRCTCRFLAAACKSHTREPALLKQWACSSRACFCACCMLSIQAANMLCEIHSELMGHEQTCRDLLSVTCWLRLVFLCNAADMTAWCMNKFPGHRQFVLPCCK